jgi:hypothetical protein
LVRRSVNGTFLQTRRFLAYHGSRFEDRSLLLQSEQGQVVAVFPAALGTEGQIVSHPGITHGGLIHDGSLSGEQAVVALRAVLAHYREAGALQLVYKLIPAVFRRSSSQDDAWALARCDARGLRSELSSVIDLQARPRVRSGRRDDLRKAARTGLEVRRDPQLSDAYWSLLERTLRARHESRPAHELAEFQDLQQRFPDRIELVTAHRGEEMLAGAVLFHFERCFHTQYLASSPEGQATGALTLVVDSAINAAVERGKAWFSLGASTTDAGRALNSGLYDWKSSFGAMGLVHETFIIDL